MPKYIVRIPDDILRSNSRLNSGNQKTHSYTLQNIHIYFMQKSGLGSFSEGLIDFGSARKSTIQQI